MSCACPRSRPVSSSVPRSNLRRIGSYCLILLMIKLLQKSSHDMAVGVSISPIERSETALHGATRCSVRNAAEYKICKPAPQPSPGKCLLLSFRTRGQRLLSSFRARGQRLLSSFRAKRSAVEKSGSRAPSRPQFPVDLHAAPIGRPVRTQISPLRDAVHRSGLNDHKRNRLSKRSLCDPAVPSEKSAASSASFDRNPVSCLR